MNFSFSSLTSMCNSGRSRLALLGWVTATSEILSRDQRSRRRRRCCCSNRAVQSPPLRWLMAIHIQARPQDLTLPSYPFCPLGSAPLDSLQWRSKAARIASKAHGELPKSIGVRSQQAERVIGGWSEREGEATVGEGKGGEGSGERWWRQKKDEFAGTPGN